MDYQLIINNLLEKVKIALHKRGSTSIRGLARTFRALDSYDGNNKVDREEFHIGLKENGVNLNKQEANMLLDYFDTNRDGNIDFNEFLVGLRGQLNEVRQEIVTKAFQKFDRDQSGSITIRDLIGVYDASIHPKVQKGIMTESQVFQEFLQNFGDQNKDGRITFDEWNDYYASVSASIDNNEHFVELMKIAWKL